MKVENTTLPGVKIIHPVIFNDKRGFFYESFNQRAFEEAGIEEHWVQDNHSKSTKGVLRGLHFQLIRPQAKLIRATQGQVFDVVVDVRRGSPTFGKWISEVLSDENKKMLYIPVGFAHGFYTMSETAEIQYKCSDFYCKEGERGILWNDPDLAIPWPTDGTEPIVSEKDLSTTWLHKTADDDLPVHGENQ